MSRSLLLCLWLVAACGSSATEAKPIRVKVPVPKEKVAQGPQLYDAAGNLLPSDARIAWLELPRGLTELPNIPEGMRSYWAKGVPIDRIQAFFGARLVAESVRSSNGGARFVRGLPESGATRETVRIDVNIRRGGPDLVRVDIEERVSLPPTRPLTEAEARSLAKEELRRAE